VAGPSCSVSEAGLAWLEHAASPLRRGRPCVSGKSETQRASARADPRCQHSGHRPQTHAATAGGGRRSYCVCSRPRRGGDGGGASGGNSRARGPGAVARARTQAGARRGAPATSHCTPAGRAGARPQGTRACDGGKRLHKMDVPTRVTTLGIRRTVFSSRKKSCARERAREQATLFHSSPHTRKTGARPDPVTHATTHTLQ
jgi:hypothetical protein